jgi:hypothetical protein
LDQINIDNPPRWMIKSIARVLDRDVDRTSFRAKVRACGGEAQLRKTLARCRYRDDLVPNKLLVNHRRYRPTGIVHDPCNCMSRHCSTSSGIMPKLWQHCWICKQQSQGALLVAKGLDWSCRVRRVSGESSYTIHSTCDEEPLEPQVLRNRISRAYSVTRA